MSAAPKRLTPEVKAGVRLIFAHHLMAALHVAKATSGMSYFDIAMRLGDPEASVRRAFWSPEHVGRMRQNDIAELFAAMDHSVTIVIKPMSVAVIHPAVAA